MARAAYAYPASPPFPLSTDSHLFAFYVCKSVFSFVIFIGVIGIVDKSVPFYRFHIEVIIHSIVFLWLISLGIIPSHPGLSTMRYHLIPIGRAVIQKTTSKSWWGYGEQGTLVHCCWVAGNVNWCIHYGKQHGGSSKN